MPQSAIVIDENDNVATASRQLEQGDSIQFEIGGDVLDITLSQSIPFGHKFALRDIERGEPIIKYGEVIGLAATAIKKGQHTHIHNVESLTGSGEEQ